MFNDLTVVDKMALERRVNNVMIEEPVCNVLCAMLVVYSDMILLAGPGGH
jgi:hypothetical protein